MKAIILEVPEEFNPDDLDHIMNDCCTMALMKYHNPNKRYLISKMFYEYYYNDNLQITYKKVE